MRRCAIRYAIGWEWGGAMPPKKSAVIKKAVSERYLKSADLENPRAGHTFGLGLSFLIGF